MERLTTEAREAILAPPTGRVTIVLDTDTKNEIDDQFAVVYALLSERIDCRAIYAAPFANRHYATAAEGMEASYQELLTIAKLMGQHAEGIPIFRGASAFLTDTGTPYENPA